MSDFDVFGDYEPGQPVIIEEDEPQPVQSYRPDSPQRTGRLFSFISFLFILATVGVIIYVVLLIMNPQASYNVLPPDTPIPTATLWEPETSESADSGSILPPTWTASPPPTTEPTSTAIATLTNTPTQRATPTRVEDQPLATNTLSLFPFTLQDGAITYTENDNGEGCAWASIAGQVFDINDDPVIGLLVSVVGDNFEQFVVTGSTPAFGESGYEVQVNTTPIEDEFVVRLYNTTGVPYSEPVVVRTNSSCERNVAIVNFVQNR